ncbi:hypothetical protein EB796_004392 [Bugula neritina]|uniref:Uncharacterized protein n=1 Tax=Bugula neritina TaxID=10212 RepID=A0A7J7KF73_BUGNE|nr:hypothetical protein EB796_004392 [Bugula neritina]
MLRMVNARKSLLGIVVRWKRRLIEFYLLWPSWKQQIGVTRKGCINRVVHVWQKRSEADTRRKGKVQRLTILVDFNLSQKQMMPKEKQM